MTDLRQPAGGLPWREHGRRKSGVLPPHRASRKVVSALLASALAVSCAPAAAFAAEGDEARATATNTEQAASLVSFANEAASYDTALRTAPDTITIDGKAYVPCYAALTYAEYWAAEGVQAAGSDDRSDKRDSCESREEYDCGAFDAVSRATANHGLHRGNFQGSIVLHCDNGQDYVLDHWDGQSTMVLADGTRAAFAKGTLTFGEGESATSTKMVTYDNIGLRYVPVAVPEDDWDAFENAYPTVTNGEQLAGGYAEQRLSSYVATAAITADTNGLKIAAKNSDGTFSFGARQTGTGTGLSTLTLTGGDRKEAEEVSTNALRVVDKSAIQTKIQTDTTYGDFIRVDLLKTYGDLGAAMYGVKWTYYGSDATRTKALATYGTKFAADNWMHKSNGIQLGLTLSERCTLPAGTDGSGYWRVTVYAMGFSDTDFDIQVAPADLRIPATQADLAATQAKASQAKPLVSNTAYTQESRTKLGELVTAAENAKLGLWAPYKREFVELNEAIDAAVKGLVKVPASTTTPSATKPTTTTKPTTSSTTKPSTSTNTKAPSSTQTTTAAKPAKQKITKLTKAKKAKRTFTVAWKKNKKAVRYEVQYSTNKSFKKAVTKKVSKKKTSLKVTKLKSGKRYYVRVRTVAKANGKVVYGAWSAKKSIIVR